MHKPMDTISSLSSGLTNIIKDSLGLVLIIISYPFLLEHLAVYEIKSSWLVYMIAFICIDVSTVIGVEYNFEGNDLSVL